MEGIALSTMFDIHQNKPALRDDVEACMEPKLR
jgi:hypothetical protein